MTILPDHMIAAAVAAGDIELRPWLPDALQPSSVDLHLGPTLLVAGPDGHRTHQLDDDGALHMYAGAFILAATLEWVGLPDDIVAHLEGKSSLGRRGLMVHITAGYVDPGWQGRLTLELHHISPVPIHLYHGMPIAQLRFSRMAAPAARPYGAPGLGSHYQGSQGPMPACSVYTRTEVAPCTP